MLRRAALVLAALAFMVGGYYTGRELVRRPVAPSANPPAPAAAVAGSPAASAGDPRPSRRERRQRLAHRGPSMALAEAIRRHASGPWVEGQGTVERVLRDDLRGRRHQRFVLELASGETLLIAHNAQLAERAPVEVGDTVRFRGRYEWNARGGTVHWTHRDPRGGSGGWLELAGRRYD